MLHVEMCDTQTSWATSTSPVGNPVLSPRGQEARLS